MTAGPARRPLSEGELWERASATLRANDLGGWTVPSAAQYPHQWNWDSGFAAIGWARLDPGRAALEIHSLLRGRWEDGMVPHVRYNPAALEDYFPGPDRWPGAAGRVVEAGQLTSGISNPPLAAIAARRVALALPEPERAPFWGAVLPPLRAWLRWFLDRRRLPGSAMPVTVHPWETGWDDSPRWDFLAPAGLRPARPYRRLDHRRVGAAERPRDRDYDAYIALAELLDGDGYDLDRYRRHSPFCVHDVALDAIWYRAATDLNLACAALGQPPAVAPGEMEAFAADFERTHWDARSGTYLDADALTGARIPVRTAAGLVAMFGGLVEASRAESIWTGYRAGGGDLLVPTVHPAAAVFDPARYWRGPVWVNVNWLVIEGLRGCGLEAEAARLRRLTLEMVAGSGQSEYFDARDGSPRGIGGFTWTAALTLDLLAGG